MTSSKKMDKKEIEQQEKNRILVKREIYCNVSILVSECITKEVLEYEEVENLYFSYKQAKRYGMIDKDVKEEDYEPQQQEIFEWWIVSDWLANKLKEQGEPILKFGNNYFWGRTTTGQAILLDDVITKINKEK